MPACRVPLMGWLIALVSAQLATAAPLPPYVGHPTGLAIAPEAEYEEFAEVEMPLADRAEPHMVRGHHWLVDTNLPDVPVDAPPATVWNRVRGLFPAPGWKIAWHNGTEVTAHYAAAGREAWGRINYADPSDMRLTVLELAAQTRALTLVPPGKTPEKFGPTDDIPYLVPLPGSSLVSGEFEDAPFVASLSEGDEGTVLAHGYHDRLYAGPPENISPLQVSAIYGPALRAAGWTIVHEWSGGYLAHFTQNGRDVWATIGSGSGDIHIRVADAGTADFTGRLRKECRAALDGVLFEFNKSVLRADSAPALERAQTAILAMPDVAFEIQGHTDNVGTAEYNRTLSQARAQSVTRWLVEHGVPAARLTSTGYGKAHPVASNDTPEGRAQNRRVELTCKK